MLELRRPELDLFSSFIEFIEEMRAHGQQLWGPYLPKEDELPQDFVSRLNLRETAPEAPFVPETIYWGVVDGNVIGRISLRHRLEGNLSLVGGHIGYEVRPSYRGRGFAKEMLRQVLLTPRAKAIGRLLLTCSPNNPASNRTILANGGVFDKTVFVDFIHDERNHYWITAQS